jgi:DNA-3-methyladenine glycosylase II
VPSAAVIAGRAPAELASMDLSQGRSIAMIRCAREVTRGRAKLDDPSGDRRLLAIPEIGPWTIQCLGLHGRGDLDSLPAGDLAYVKLVGHLAGLGRRATAEEVEEYFAPYAPFRGLAGAFALVGWHKAVGSGPPARLAA